VVGAASSRFGRIDVVINNAGILISKPFTEYTTEDLNALVSTTMVGFLYLSQRVVKEMVKQKNGCIVSISTTL
jgi:NADP-dependent 3-hydroxy acid dehydrogenase YdfG